MKLLGRNHELQGSGCWVVTREWQLWVFVSVACSWGKGAPASLQVPPDLLPVVGHGQPLVVLGQSHAMARWASPHTSALNRLHPEALSCSCQVLVLLAWHATLKFYFMKNKIFFFPCSLCLRTCAEKLTQIYINKKKGTEHLGTVIFYYLVGLGEHLVPCQSLVSHWICFILLHWKWSLMGWEYLRGKA